MSYAIAPTFEGNRLGVRRLSALGNAGVMLGGLGDIQGTASTLIATGWDPSIVNGLLQAGASDQQLIDLLNGATDVQTILMQQKAAQSGGINPAIGPAAPPVVAQIPSGATLLYSASWGVGLGSLTVTPISAIAQMQGALPTYGMSISSGKPLTTGLFGGQIQLTIQVTGKGFALVRDAQSILDSLLHNIVGSNVTGSNLQIVAAPGQPLPVGIPGGATDLTTWFEANAGYIGAGIAALVVVGIVWGRK